MGKTGPVLDTQLIGCLQVSLEGQAEPELSGTHTK
jgi:hypothetical protein